MLSFLGALRPFAVKKNIVRVRYSTGDYSVIARNDPHNLIRSLNLFVTASRHMWPNTRIRNNIDPPGGERAI